MWSAAHRELVEGAHDHYAYYHCQRQCRAVNVSKKKLEGLFVDEVALLQPTPGYMRLVKDRVLYVWQQLTSEIKDRAAESERRVKAISRSLTGSMRRTCSRRPST